MLDPEEGGITMQARSVNARESAGEANGRRNCLVSTTVIAVLAAASTCAVAQTQDSQTGAEDTAQPIADIVVTAQRISQSAQTVPVALSALSAEDLEERQIFGLLDVKQVVPNLYLEENLSNAGTPKAFMRGIGQANSAFSFDSPIGIYVDDVYYAKQVGALVDFFDIERIEVLRGPQGTIYGRNSSIGAIRVVTRKPPLDEFDAVGDVTIGSVDQLNARLAIGVPLVRDRAGLRVAFNRRGNDGFQVNSVNGERTYSVDSNAVRAQLLTRISDSLSLTLRGDYLRDDSRPAVATNFRNNDLSDLTFQSNRFYSDGTAFSRLETSGGSATLEWAIGDVSLTAISALRKVETINRFDADGTLRASFEVARSDLDDQAFTQEVFLTGPRLGSLPISWVAGAFYLHETTDYVWSLQVLAPPSVQFFDQQVDSYAAYLQGTYALTDRLNFTAGVRHTTEDKNFDVESFEADGTFDFSFSDHTLSISKWTWRAAVDYRFDQPVMLFASVATGFRSGGLNGNATSLEEVTGGAFEPEDTLMYEVGIKSDLFSRRLRLNASYFFGEYDNLQQPVVTDTGVVSNTNNSVKVRGLELEARYTPTDRLELTAAVGTLHDEIRNSPTTLPNAPALTWNASVAYLHPVGALGIAKVGASYAYTGSTHMNNTNTPDLEVGSYHIVDAYASFTTLDEHWRFTLAGRNLNDDVHAIGGFLIAGGSIAATQWPSLPRRWSFSVQYQY